MFENVQGLGFNQDGKNTREIPNLEVDEDESDEKETQFLTVLPQLIACLVSMGYQVHKFDMNGENYGSIQHRPRLIITIVAPGLSPIVIPPDTHGTLETVQATHQPDEYPLDKQKYSHVPFRRLNSQDGTQDLPDIGTGVVHACIPFPDHRLPYFNSAKTRRELAQIPPSYSTRPHPKGLRICKCCPMPTIRTNNKKQSEGYQPSVHWDQDRLLTILDARRAQGWLDDEIVVGTSGQQYIIVGNGVDRFIAFPLGLSHLQSYLKDMDTERGRIVFSQMRQDQGLPVHDQVRLVEDHHASDTNASGIEEASVTSTTPAAPHVRHVVAHDSTTAALGSQEGSTQRSRRQAKPVSKSGPQKGEAQPGDTTGQTTSPPLVELQVPQAKPASRIETSTNDSQHVRVKKRRRISKREVAALGSTPILPRRDRTTLTGRSTTITVSRSQDITSSNDGPNVRARKRGRVSKREVIALGSVPILPRRTRTSLEEFSKSKDSASGNAEASEHVGNARN